jgi:hypothetical protein
MSAEGGTKALQESAIAAASAFVGGGVELKLTERNQLSIRSTRIWHGACGLLPERRANMPTNSKLWQRIEAFDIDRHGDENSFSARLAGANGWSPVKAGAAIEEYKKFIYLVCAVDSPLAPRRSSTKFGSCISWTHGPPGPTREASSAADPQRADRRRPGADVPPAGPLCGDALALHGGVRLRAPAEFWPPVSERFAAATSRQEIVRNSGWIAPAPSGYGSILWCIGAALLAVTASYENLAAAVQPATASSGSLGPMLVAAAVVALARLVVRGLRRTPPDDADKGRSAGGYGRGDSGGGGSYWGCEGEGIRPRHRRLMTPQQ